MNISPNFTLKEFTKSATAEKHKVDNTPSQEHLINLKKLAHVLEDVRKLLGDVPIIISSGYRSPKLNELVDGSATSSHCFGLAVDFSAPKFGTIEDVCNAIAKSGIQFDQLIFEQTSRTKWVHLGIGDKMRRQVLSWKSGKGYVNGIKAL